MRQEYKIGLYVLRLLITILLSSVVGMKYTFPVPAPAPIGLGCIALFLCVDLWWEKWRWMSKQTISNVGHYSINTEEDIYHIPWMEDIVTEDEKKNINLGDLTFMFTGGILNKLISTSSPPEFPIWIFPSIYEEKEEKNYHVHANLKRVNFNELSPYIRHILIKKFRNRIKKHTPIYFGCTSHLDGSAIPENLKIEFKKLAENTQFNELDERLKKVYEELRRVDQRKKSKVIIGKEIKPIEEGA